MMVSLRGPVWFCVFIVFLKNTTRDNAIWFHFGANHLDKSRVQ
ncbi:hypothetical protein Z950_2078 [Sulfitobacter mediterraneus KCTC 32188]|nr:hypothetical protein Z950_2078 [Sulfitobacter mediterraneus KCTC 32188]